MRLSGAWDTEWQTKEAVRDETADSEPYQRDDRSDSTSHLYCCLLVMYDKFDANMKTGVRDEAEICESRTGKNPEILFE